MNLHNLLDPCTEQFLEGFLFSFSNQAQRFSLFWHITISSCAWTSHKWRHTLQSLMSSLFCSSSCQCDSSMLLCGGSSFFLYFRLCFILWLCHNLFLHSTFHDTWVVSSFRLIKSACYEHSWSALCTDFSLFTLCWNCWVIG